MISETDNLKLEKLKKLVVDYSYPEKRYQGIINEIDQLLAWACKNFVCIGHSSLIIQELIGAPYAIIGDGKSNEIEWLFPGLEKENNLLEFSTQWFYVFTFINGKLQLTSKRKYTYFT